MTFETEEARLAFHSLTTQTQVEWLAFEEALADSGKSVHVTAVTFPEGGGSEISIRVDEKSK